MTALRAGIIGLGVGEEQIAGYQEAGCEVVALCDFDPERLAEVGARHPDIDLRANAALEPEAAAALEADLSHSKQDQEVKKYSKL